MLANKTRLDILTWLKDPLAHFDKPSMQLSKNINEDGGVCVRDIQEKANMSQSTVSHYLQMMHKAGLLESERHGQWTYYRRNEDVLRQVASYVEHDL